MKMYRKLTSPLLVIIAGLLVCIATADAQNPSVYPLCQLSTPTVLSVTPTSDPFIIQSPDYGYSYPNNVDCTLTIASGAEPMVLSFEYRVFNLEGATDCVFDYLCVVGVKFCGNWATGSIFKRILPPRRNSTVHFHTDSSVTRNGFYIIVTSQPALPISQVQGSGWSSDGITYVPATYYPGMPYTDGCSQSFVEPNYGLNDTDDSIANVTNEQTTTTTRDTPPSTVDILEGDTTIGPTNPRVYTLCQLSTPPVLTVTPTSQPFIIQSPYYPLGGYPNNVDCTLTIASGAEPMVLSFEYRLFSLELANNCVYDYLCVVGVKFCGNWAIGSLFKQILPPLSNSTVLFHTDSSVAWNGFYITVTSQPVLPINQVQGSGWSSDGITYVPATYYPGMPYTDGCRPNTVVPNYGLNDTDDSIANVTNAQNTRITQDTTPSTGEILTEDTTMGPTNPRVYTLCQLSTPPVLTVTPTSQPFIIQSPNYPFGSYPNNVDCTLTITSGAEPMVLSFEYRAFNLEVATECVYDYLCVVGVKFCGYWSTGKIFKRILPPQSNSTVHFHTDYSVTLNGFYIIVTSQPVLPINQVQGSGWSSDSITYVPATYYPGMPYTDGCSQSFVVPNYGLNHTDEYTGSVTNEQTTITTQDITTSTEEIPAEDTSITPTQQDTYYFCDNEQSTIDINNDSSPFLIRSPNYGRAPYNNYLYCSLAIRSGAEPLVLSLRIKDFQAEYQTSCNYDYLCVHGTKFCGDWLSGYTFQYILPQYSRFTATFRTDYSVTQRGFEIEVSQQLATTNQIIRQPSGDFASSNAAVFYTWETYSPGYPYRDRCSPEVPTTANIFNPTVVPSSTAGPGTSNIPGSTTAPPSNGNFCYSAAQVQQLNEIIDNAIAGLNAARELLLPRK